MTEIRERNKLKKKQILRGLIVLIFLMTSHIQTSMHNKACLENNTEV